MVALSCPPLKEEADVVTLELDLVVAHVVVGNVTEPTSSAWSTTFCHNMISSFSSNSSSMYNDNMNVCTLFKAVSFCCVSISSFVGMW